MCLSQQLTHIILLHDLDVHINIINFLLIPANQVGEGKGDEPMTSRV
jgi:hypothetical protein